MVINGSELLQLAPIRNMLDRKVHGNGVSHGLSEAGYDIRIKQEIVFRRDDFGGRCVTIKYTDTANYLGRVQGNFVIASTLEEFDMPCTLLGIVHDKSSWARRGLSVFNTVVEPGWKGFLTLELVYHGQTELVIPAGSGIAQCIFHEVSAPARYQGRYQNQADEPVPAIEAPADVP